jgi:hypothetical protein
MSVVSSANTVKQRELFTSFTISFKIISPHAEIISF